MKKVRAKKLTILPEVITTIKRAEQIVGGCSNVSKMPGRSISTPARHCNVGSRLQKVKGSVCFNCYAKKNMYVLPSTQNALDRRYNALRHPQWIEAMVFMLNKRAAKEPYFRWHDSGDIQGLWHLENIAEVAKQTPTVTHWIPTREYEVVKAYIAKHGAFPSNLTVRLSAHMVGNKPPAIHGLPTSTVSWKASDRTCPAPKQEGKCNDCRACWDPTVSNVNYHQH